VAVGVADQAPERAPSRSVRRRFSR
jgi:hypothetical protein